jgi:hypothetical protein
MIAEDIAIGDRSYRNLVKIPDLPTSGFDAIEELHQRGLVKASWSEDRVEPTEAFWPWLEEVRQAEEQQAAAQQNSPGSPERESLATSQATRVPTLSFPSPVGGTGSLPDALAPAAGKPRRPRSPRLQKSLFSHLTGTAALASRILYKLDELVGYSDEISMRDLERATNAYKYPLWPAAWRMVTERGCVEVTPGSNRQQLIRLVRVPGDLQWRCELTSMYKPPRRRRRPQTEWFREHLPEFLRRDGYGDRAEVIEEYRRLL